MPASEKFKKQNAEDWSKVLHAIFGDVVPSRCEWSDIDDIIVILNKLGSIDAVNHLFFPDGGGQDLLGAKRSPENDCIEIDTTGISRVFRSKVLIFEKIDDTFEWSYFRLEASKLAPSDVCRYSDMDYKSEEVLELEPCVYVDRCHWDENSYQGQPLPLTARPISRYFKGAFVIFKKTSFYNAALGELDAYDGRHDNMNAMEFRKYIEDYANAVRASLAN